MTAEQGRWSLAVLAVLFASLVALVPVLADAATIIVINNDGAGEGFNFPVGPAAKEVIGPIH